MARPSRCRRVCTEPFYHSFAPCGAAHTDTVTLTVDEYEVIRLVDHEKRTHAQCARQMAVSRTTVTEIYESARFKLSDSLVNGKALVIEGGHYRICQGDLVHGCGGCCPWASHPPAKQKGADTMTIAVPYENGMIFQHFGHTQQMKLYTVEQGAVTGASLADTSASGHGALVGFLTGHGVDTLICGGIGGGARDALARAGIRLYGGVTGSADEAVSALLAGTLSHNPDASCGHHEHGGDHHCGQDSHGCGGA